MNVDHHRLYFGRAIIMTLGIPIWYVLNSHSFVVIFTDWLLNKLKPRIWKIAMDIDVIRQLLENYKAGEVSIQDVLGKIRELPNKDIGFAKVDSHRKIRCGFPEVIFCLGKTPEQVVKIVEHIGAGENDMLATRATKEIYQIVSHKFPEAVYHEQARTITIRKTRRKPHKGLVLIITAGTSDIPVAESTTKPRRRLAPSSE